MPLGHGSDTCIMNESLKRIELLNQTSVFRTYIMWRADVSSPFGAEWCHDHSSTSCLVLLFSFPFLSLRCPRLIQLSVITLIKLTCVYLFLYNQQLVHCSLTDCWILSFGFSQLVLPGDWPPFWPGPCLCLSLWKAVSWSFLVLFGPLLSPLVFALLSDTPALLWLSEPGFWTLDSFSFSFIFNSKSHSFSMPFLYFLC